MAADEVATGRVAADAMATARAAADAMATGGVAADAMATGGVAADAMATGGVAADGVVPAGLAGDRAADDAPLRRLLPLDGGASRAAGPGWLVMLAGRAGAKAARLARAADAGLAVLPGWVIPVAESRPAVRAGAAAVQAGRPAAARRAVLAHRLDDGLAAELREAVGRLGGRVIVRSSSPLEGDSRWSGAFSSVAEVGPDDVGTAVRSCWASAFAVDPLARLAACGLPAEALELGVLIQPEIHPVAGGTARVTGAEVIVEGVRGHPGALLSGWAEGASACVRLPDAPPDLPPAAGRPPGGPGGNGLTRLLSPPEIAAVAALAGQVWRLLGDDVIEWAAGDGGIWLLQSLRSGAADGQTSPARDTAPSASAVQLTAGRMTAGPAAGAPAGGLATPREWPPLLAATVLAQGERVPGRPGAPGMAVGRLLPCRPHERPAGDCTGAILLVDRPLPALAPLLFAAQGVIVRAGAAGSHLAQVARCLGVPMVLGCHPELVTGPAPVRDGAFLAAIDGSTGEVALLPAPVVNDVALVPASVADDAPRDTPLSRASLRRLPEPGASTSPGSRPPCPPAAGPASESRWRA